MVDVDSTLMYFELRNVKVMLAEVANMIARETDEEKTKRLGMEYLRLKTEEREILKKQFTAIVK